MLLWGGFSNFMSDFSGVLWPAEVDETILVQRNVFDKKSEQINVPKWDNVYNVGKFLLHYTSFSKSYFTIEKKKSPFYLPKTYVLSSYIRH